MFELVCQECRVCSDANATGWRAYRVAESDENGAPELAFYCPRCAELEFGPVEHIKEDVAAESGE